MATAAPGAWWGDGLELAAAAKVLGIPHPTGYPLYTLLAGGAIRIFAFADPGRVTTLLSSVFCLGSVLLIGATVYARAMRADAGAISDGPEKEARRVTQPKNDQDRSSPPLILGLGVMLLLAFSRTLWEHATFTEVYPLTLLSVSALVAVIAFPLQGQPSILRILLLSGICGISLVNHYSAAVMAPLVIFQLIAWGWRAKRIGLYLGVFLAIALPHLLFYLYLPLRAAANPPLNWGDPSNLERFFWMLRGGDYASVHAGGDGGWIEAIRSGGLYWIPWWGRQVLPDRLGAGTIATATVGFVLAFGGAIGCALMMKRRPALGAGLLVSLFATILFPILYPIPDLDAYLLPALPAVALGWGQLATLALRPAPGMRVLRGLKYAVAALPGLLSVAMFFGHLPAVSKSWDFGPQRWSTAALEALPENALIITRQGADSEIYALWYAQMAEGKRPDVTAFGSGFIFSGWYQKFFDVESRPQIPVFVVQRPPGTKAEFDIALIGGVVIPNLPHRRVFITYLDPIIEKHLNPKPVAELLPESYYELTAYKLNPPGRILYEISVDPEFESIARSRFREIFDREPPAQGS